MHRRKTWELGLIILLLLQVVVAFSLGIFSFANFQGLLEQFGMQYQPDMGILQLIMVYNLFLSLSICLWSVIWIRRGNVAGIHAGITVGLLMLLVSLAVYIQFNRIDILLFDGIRAFLMVVFGMMVYREFKRSEV